ncbi:putative Heat shock protein 70 family [Helianthus anomalus]
MLMHDGTAIAVGYGMYKTDFSNWGPMYVMFVDIGHCDTQVTVAAFEQGRMKIMSHSFDQNLGGRDFDEVLFKHFATQFNEKYNIDVNSNARASVRLRESCEKVKKVPIANTEAPISIECLIGDTDVTGLITRDEFENMSSKLLERVTVPFRMALKDSGLSADELYTIELFGSRKEPTRTLNASECVARGCALLCAMLSPTLIVRDYKIRESFPYSIVIPSPQGECMIGPSETSDSEKVEVQFKVKLNGHGIVEINSAIMMLMGNTKTLNLPTSENLDVSTTNDELHEAKEKEKKLTEQDIKVEETKDQRNTLESFVYDTRSKVLIYWNNHLRS